MESFCIRQNLSQICCDWYNKKRGGNAARLNGNYNYIEYNHKTDKASLCDMSHFPEITLEKFINLTQNNKNNWWWNLQL